MLVAIEGLDGAGKRTQANLLSMRAQSVGMTASLLTFPRYGATFFSESISSYLRGAFGDPDCISPYLAALLFAGDRFESRERLNSELQSSDIVILDRYVPSNMAYQSARANPDDRTAIFDWIARLEFGVYHLPVPSLNILLDIAVDQALIQMQNRALKEPGRISGDMNETNGLFLGRCREAYLQLTKTEYCGPWVSVPCTDHEGSPRSAADINEELWRIVLGTWRSLESTGAP